MKRIATAMALAVAAACGGGSAQSHNNPGSGTSTLLVTANVNASMTAGGPVTAFSVDVEDGLANPISGATVTISNPDLGDVPLVEASTGSGHYTNSKALFPGGDFRLTVVRGKDSVVGVVVGSPGANTVNAPTRNTTVAASPQPLNVSWTTPTTAKSVLITTRDFQGYAADNGAYVIPAAMNPARTNQRLILARTNDVDIAGGISGSTMRVTFTTTVDPFVVQ